jgi:homoserine kinase type II
MKMVYPLYHSRPIDDDEEDEKLVGIYSSRAQAEAAIERLRDKPGFRDFPDGFHIYEDELDRDGWTEGFLTGEQALRALEKDK